MRTSLRRFPAVVVTLSALSNLHADTWASPEKKDYASSSGQYVFTVEPSAEFQPGRCKGTLSSITANKRVICWSRPLINNVSPVSAFVADSGRYVVTLDEWHNVGDFPVVIYGPLGSLIYVHNRESLHLEKDILYIKQTVSSFWWSENSLAFFSPDSEVLFIRLHWGGQSIKSKVVHRPSQVL